MDTVAVSAPRPRSDQRFKVEHEENRLGLTDDLNKLIFFQPGIERIPEAGSALLVRGQGLYDTRYEVLGVPMFSISHFPHNTFCDRSGQMIAAVEEVRVNTRNLAGRYLDASGGVIEIDPGSLRYADKNLKRRPELVFQIGSLASDASISFPGPNGGFHQFSANYAHQFNIVELGSRNFGASERALSGRGKPISYADFVYTGRNVYEDAAFRHHLWIAYDSYRQEVVPWGMGAIDFVQHTSGLTWHINAGAANQKFFEGKRYGTTVPRKDGQITTGNVTLDLENIRLGDNKLRIQSRLTAQEYETRLETELREYGTNEYLSTDIHQVDGRDGMFSVSAHLESRSGFFHYGLDLLGGTTVPEPKSIADAGAWIRIARSSADILFLSGVQTSRPDIRGLPDSNYRNRLSRTYSLESKLNWRPVTAVRSGANVYVRYKDRCPAFAQRPGALLWDPSEETRLLSTGLIMDFSADFGEKVTIITMGQLGSSRRVEKGTYSPYEWNLPWSSKAVLNLHLLQGNLEVFLTGVAAAGLSYRDLLMTSEGVAFDTEPQRVKPYTRVDLKAHFKQPTENHRWLTRYEVYAEVSNILAAYGEISRTGAYNVREYYWDEKLRRRPITLDPFLDLATLNLGVRAGFRL